MSWSIFYNFAIKAEKETIENIKNFFGQFPLTQDYTRKIYDLNEVRRALYGNKMQELGDRVICGGPGAIEELTFDKNGMLHIEVEAISNCLETKKFIKALRKKVGKFRYAVLVVDDCICQDEMPWTTDLTGEFFPHFLLQEGTPEQMKGWPSIHKDERGFKEMEIPNSTELLKELRKRGFQFRSFKELNKKNPQLSFKDAKGNTIIGVWGYSSGKQTILNPQYVDF